MGDRQHRAEKIRSSAKDHPVVRFAVHSLLPSETGFSPRPHFSALLEEKLRALGPTDELVAAALGLVDLAYLLRKQASAEAADAIVAALASAQGLVDDALSAIPLHDAALAELRSSRFATFLGEPGSSAAERRPPAENEVAAGPQARWAMSRVAFKKEK